MKLFLLIGFILLSACAKSGGDGSGSQSKKLFSVWEKEGGQGEKLDLSKVTFGPHVIEFKVAANASCFCNVMIEGKEDSGRFLISSCSYQGPGASVCGQYANVKYSYANVNANLLVCNEVATCFNYK